MGGALGWPGAGRGRAAAIALALAGGVPLAPVAAQDTPPVAIAAPATAAADPVTAPDGFDRFALHAQATFTLQATPGFPSPYAGPNSLRPNQARETFDATLFAGARLWRGAEAWANPEVDQGFGLSNTLGVAGFPSAEAYKVGRATPYWRLQRLFVRQTVALGGGRLAVAAGPNQFAQATRADRLVVTIGKFGVGDVFDTNRYAHDPRADFLNWSAVDAGSFDYAADAWGYSTGVAAEWYRGDWTGRAGLFNLSRVPNGEVLERTFRQFQLDGEVEHRHRIGGRDGAVRVALFRNQGRFGRFADALALAGMGVGVPDTATVRARRVRIGVHLNAEQAVADHLGVFARAGWADGSIEPYDFTDIDRTAAVGLSADGGGWGRGRDAVGLALVANGISRVHRAYLAAGGVGVLIGDGRLPDYGAEGIAEGWYRVALGHGAQATIDYQFVDHPGYNAQRGPAHVLALRLHVAG